MWLMKELLRHHAGIELCFVCVYKKYYMLLYRSMLQAYQHTVCSGTITTEICAF